MQEPYKVRTVPIPELTERQKENFARKTRFGGGCWEWLGYKGRGYGQFSIRVGFKKQKTFKSHRIAFQLSGEELLYGYTINHLCRNRSCVNPFHLRQISFVDNIMCGESPTAKYARLNHCKYGHELKRASWSKRRFCPICQRNNVLRFHRKRKLADFRAVKK